MFLINRNLACTGLRLGAKTANKNLSTIRIWNKSFGEKVDYL
jgi:hypothetical protein